MEWYVFIDIHDLDGGREEFNHEFFLFVDVFVLGAFVDEDTGYLKGSDDKYMYLLILVVFFAMILLHLDRL